MTTTLQSPAISGLPVHVYARLLRAQHALIAQGKGDSAEAEAIADQMDAPWYAMSDQERERMRGLSCDLYALAEGGAKQVDMTPEDTRQWQESAKAAYAGFPEGDVDSMLAFLRRTSPKGLPRHVIPFLQARCWERLGDLETALVFMREAERHDPKEAVSVLTLLGSLGRTEEATKYANAIIRDPSSTPGDLFLSAAQLLSLMPDMDEGQARSILEQLVPVLRGALKSLAALPKQQWDVPDLDVSIPMMLGLCLERLGDVQGAVTIYDEALSRHPNHGELLTFRGTARFERDQASALRDLAKAAQVGASLVWPYLLLARNALLRGNYAEALRQALRASEQPATAPARAEVYETIAIAYEMLGQPLSWVLENFNQALALHPTNQRIRHNREVAETRRAARQPHQPRWQYSAQPDLAKVRLNILRSAMEREQDWISGQRSERVAATLPA